MVKLVKKDPFWAAEGNTNGTPWVKRYCWALSIKIIAPSQLSGCAPKQSPLETHTSLHQKLSWWITQEVAQHCLFHNRIWKKQSPIWSSPPEPKHASHLMLSSTAEHPKSSSGIFIYKDWLLVPCFWVYLGTVQLPIFAGITEMLCRSVL